MVQDLISGCSYLDSGEELQMFPYGEQVKEDVLLRTHACHLSDLEHVIWISVRMIKFETIIRRKLFATLTAKSLHA